MGRSTLLTALVLAPLVATAAVPTTMPLHGVLRDQAGVLVEQGTFEVTFTLYDGETSDSVIWSETWPELAVNGGAFSVVLGSVVPLTPNVFVDVAEAWMGISVAGEPELPRRPMGADAFAFVAGHAESADTASSIQCSGCIPKSALAFQIPDGTAATLPADGLDEVSNGVLTTTFDTTHASTDTPILNNPLTGLIESTIVVPKLGFAQSVAVTVDIAHGNIGEITVTLRSPTGAEFVFHDKTDAGQVNLQGTFDHTSELSAGSLADVLNTDVDGGWKLTIEDLVVGTQGQLNSWNIQFVAVSDNKAQVNGDLVVTGGLTVAGGLDVSGGELKINGDVNLQGHQLKLPRFHISNGPPAACTEETLGLFYLDTSDNLVKVCVDGVFQSMNNICGDGVVSAAEECDDSNSKSGDGCSQACALESGWVCTGQNGTVCTPICGDGVLVSDEQCDDGNKVGGDGCSGTCTLEAGWTCSGPTNGVCVETCGDGQVVGGEACDDGNNNPNDCCNNCSPASAGVAYDNICLVGLIFPGTTLPSPPAGCTPHLPNTGWVQSDFTAICQGMNSKLGATANCTTIDGDADGGYCSNHTQLLATWDQQSSTDIWANSAVWSYQPPGGSCNFEAFGGDMVAIWACQ